MTDKARIAAAGAMNNVRTAIDSAKRIGFPGNPVGTCIASVRHIATNMVLAILLLLANVWQCLKAMLDVGIESCLYQRH